MLFQTDQLGPYIIASIIVGIAAASSASFCVLHPA